MATNRSMVTKGIPTIGALAVLLLCAAAPVRAREAASDSQCQAAASQPAMAGAIAQVTANPDELRSVFTLADAWSDAGCFANTVTVLQNAEKAHPESAELQTRLRVAKSLVREEHFFDDLDRADTQVKLKRAMFRCETLADVGACGDALVLRPDDPAILSAQGDAYLRAQRPRDALSSYRRASALAPDAEGMAAKIHAAEIAALPLEVQATNSSSSPRAASKHPVARLASVRLYSNRDTPGQTH